MSMKKKICLILVIIPLSQSSLLIQTNKSMEKRKDETGGVAIEEFVGLKSKMYWLLVDNSKHKKANGGKK